MAMSLTPESIAEFCRSSKRMKHHEHWRETFRNYRIPKLGCYCYTHLDQEPCAECWLPHEDSPWYVKPDFCGEE